MTDEELTELEVSETDIAIVGMAGRFPGAPDVDELWRRAEAGDDCLTDLTAEQLAESGVPRSVSDDPDYVRRAGVLDHVEGFDAGFFGIGPRDASIMDPQHRHFMELCWEALETSGHVPDRFDGAIGVFAGCGFNTYMLHNLLTNAELVDQVGMFLLRHTANDKDFLSTTVSYRLDLRGPSVNVQTACSTSLVAVHLAVQSLLAFECDIALAGGSTIQVPHLAGYTYHEGEILSPDGYCRAFDERSAGTVLTSGAGVVALRRLVDAVDGDDPVLAVIKGSAINNDGQRKVGYLAPSVDGHADVVQEALAVAGLSARDIQLLEAHGTGTSVGDPIEVAALTEAFRASTGDTGFCRLGSSKPSIGHLDTAAGVASLIKAVQALRHQTLPPLANHTAPSPLLDLERTPFVLSASAAPWPGGPPRRAGISSLGVGGTNAHVVIEEAPPRRVPPPAPPEQVLALSAVDPGTLDATARRLADALAADPQLELADVAHTLAAGRRAMSHRRVVVATDTAAAVDVLRGGDRNRVASSVAPDAPSRVAFLFPGGGSQYLGMAAGLDERFDVFHEVMADGIRLVQQRSGLDLAPLLHPDAPPEALRKTTASLPAVFLTSVALARQWMAWGVTPDAFVGHSLGEYTAAHLAGVLTLEGALDLILARATLMDQVSGVGAAMLAVPLPVAEVEPMLPPSLSVATINASDECVIAGPADDLEILAKKVAKRDVEPTLIPLDAAAHSSMLDPVLPEFLDTVRGIPLTPPETPYLSNLTGTWITADQATDPAYWVDHLRHTVRFADCLRAALADGPLVVLEMGPGHALSSYARRQETAPVAAVPVLRHPNQVIDDTAYALLAVGRAWAAGLDVDLDRFSGPDRLRLRLPGYPFRREPHWIEPGTDRLAAPAPAAAALATARAVPEVRRVTDVTDSFWSPTWVEAPRTAPPSAPVGPWLLVGAPDDDLVGALARELTTRGHHAEVCTTRGQLETTDARSIVLVGPTTDVTAAAERWLAEGSLAARALGAADAGPTLLAAVTRGATDVEGPAVAPADAMAAGIIRTAPREYLGLRTTLVDLAPAASGAPDLTADAAAVVAELLEGDVPTVALRGDRRLVPRPERERIAAAPVGTTFREGGRYLVTGGLGGVGFAVACRLAEQHRADIAVVASRAVPEGADRDRWLAHHGPDDPTSRRIRRLAELESLGTRVVAVTADAGDPASIAAALDQAEATLGPLDGVVHAAGEVRDRPIELATDEDHEVVLGAKARGALALVDELAHRRADLLVLVSSTSTLLAPEGQAAYVAANSVLDSLAGDHDGLRVRTIDYGLWSDTGVVAARRYGLGLEPGTAVAHPVLSTSSTERDGTVSLVGSLDAAHQWVVDEHRTTDGVAVLPGTGHLELFLAAAELADAGSALEAVTLVSPLVVPDDAHVIVRVQLSPPGHDDRRWLRLESDGGVGAWHLHSEASLAPAPPPVAEDGVPTRTAAATDVDVVSGPSARMRFGPRWHTVRQAWRDGDEVAGRLELEQRLAEDADAWLAHPALVDVATMFGMVLGDHPDHLYVPVGYERVTLSGPLPTTPWVRARLTGTDSADVLRIDVTLGADDGTTLLSLEGLALRPVAGSEVLGIDGREDDEPAEHVHRVPPLLAVAGPFGIGADEGVEMLERLLGSGRPRLIASSIELDDLLPLVAPPPPAPGHATDAAIGSSGAATSVLSTIRDIWVELLGVPDVGDDDDFFDLGGHSLIAIRLMARIHKQLGVRFQLATIFDAPTVAALAEEVRAARPELDDELAAGAGATAAVAPGTTETVAVPHRSLVTITTEGDERPLFVVHGAGGNVLFLWTLARAMAGTRPLYGFQARGVDGGDMPDATIEAMAERYVTELRAAHDGPYLLGGYSGGGLVAFEMVRQLQALGEQVDQLVLFDSPVPGEEALSAGQQWYWFLRNLRRFGLGAMKPYMRWRARELAHLYLPFVGKRGREQEIANAARQIGAVDVENLGFVDLYYYFSAAAGRYSMPQLEVDVVLVKADRIWPVHPHDYHWSRFILGRIDVISTPGDHWAMFYPENVPHLAEALMPVLDRRRP